MSLKVLITDHAWPTIEPETTVLMEEAGAEVIVAPDTLEETLVSMATNVDAIMTCFAQVTSNDLRAAKRCMVVGRFGDGVDNIDVQTATDLGMVVTYVPDYCVDEVSDHVMALLLTWNRRIALLDRSVKTTGWGSIPLTMRIMRLRDKTLGIVGLGNIGMQVALRAQPLGMEVVAHDPFVSQEVARDRGVQLVTSDELFDCSDYVTLHLAVTPETKDFLDDKAFARMKDGVRIVNCARGELIDADALARALDVGKVSGAALDVFEHEPNVHKALLALDNVLLTPHIGSGTVETRTAMADLAALNVIEVLSGNSPLTPVL